MLAVVAAVLFALALLFQLLAVSIEVIGPSVLTTAGLLCIALYFAGVGSRSVSYRRSRR